MISKINRLDNYHLQPSTAQLAFLIENKFELEQMSSLAAEEFERINMGDTLSNLLAERALIKKFG